jgi:hypothetical protein
MKNSLILFILVTGSLISSPAFSQTETQTENDTALLGLPGDNLDLFAVLNIFQKSKTIEDFEKTMNLKETGINNLDLNLNDTVDFIKVMTKQDKNDFTFILQVDVSKTEVQDVAVILVSKDKDGKVIMQIVGDKDLYGKDYVIEPQPPAPAVTPNPAYAGTDPVTAAAPATTTVVVVESAPIVQYVYSPVYVPYYPPYYYAYYPPYYNPYTIMVVSVYHHNNYYHHGGYHGGGNTVVIHNENNYNNYNNSRNSSNTVNNNNKNGNYNKNNASARPSAGTSASPSSNQARGSSASAKPSTSQTKGSSQAAKPSTSQSKGSSASTKTSTSNNSASSRKSGSSSRSGGLGSRRR